MSSLPNHLDDSTRPMPTRLLSSLKRPFSRPKNDHDRNPSFPPESTRGPPIHREAPPNYQQIAMGLHLSRTPHIPARLTSQMMLYPPAPAVRRSVSAPVPVPRRPSFSHTHSLSPPHTHSHLHPHSHSHSRRDKNAPRSLLGSSSRSHSHSPARRLPPPPARSALKKSATTTSSSVTPDTASASTVASSVGPLTPTKVSGGLLARFLGKERAPRARAVVVLPVRERERKAVRFGGLIAEEEES